MKKEQFVCSALAAAFIGILFFGTPGGVQAADPIKLNYSIFFPAPHKTRCSPPSGRRRSKSAPTAPSRSPSSPAAR
ncbi:MAG: hypothetical protein MZU91_13600 [Desulfosudis oleivorans]|nr:hypothetical protein [Desulfosudis oleivorans]